MCQKESWGAIFATKEAHFTQRDQPPRMHGPGLWMYEQKEQRVTPVRMIGVNCILWCPGWDGKDLGGRPEQDPGYTSRRPRIHLQRCIYIVYTFFPNFDEENSLKGGINWRSRVGWVPRTCVGSSRTTLPVF